MGEIVGVEIEAPEVHGFAVELKVGPYPLAARGTHRRAIYAFLRPLDERARQKMRNVTGKRDPIILGSAELNRQGLEAFRAGRHDELEAAAAGAVREAANLAAKVKASLQ